MRLEPGSWQEVGDAALDRLLVEASAWRLGRRAALFDVEFVVDASLAETILESARTAIASHCLEMLRGQVAVPRSGIDPHLERTVRDAVVRVLEERPVDSTEPIELGIYPSTPIVHESGCTADGCKCPDCLSWIAAEARRRHPDLASEINSAALDRALKGEFDRSIPTRSRLGVMYRWILLDVIRKSSKADNTSPETFVSLSAGEHHDVARELVGEWLIARLESDVSTEEALSKLSDGELRRWMLLSEVGRSILADLDGGILSFPPAIVAEGRTMQLAARTTIVALHASSAGGRREKAVEAQLRIALRSAVGGGTPANGRQRLHRSIPSAVALVLRSLEVQ